MRILRYMSVVMGLLFLFAAAVQWNDPDPLLWIAIYSGAAAASFLFVKKPSRWQPAAVIAAASFLWALALARQGLAVPGLGDIFDEFQMADERIEIAREMLGLIVVTAWMITIAIVGKRKERKQIVNT